MQSPQEHCIRRALTLICGLCSRCV